MKEGYILTVFKNERLSWLPYIAIVILLHVIGFSFLSIAGKDHHILFGIGDSCICILGLRHAFDADHIAAINNTVRKLLGNANSIWCCVLLLFNWTFICCIFNGCFFRGVCKMG